MTFCMSLQQSKDCGTIYCRHNQKLPFFLRISSSKLFMFCELYLLRLVQIVANDLLSTYVIFRENVPTFYWHIIVLNFNCIPMYALYCTKENAAKTHVPCMSRQSLTKFICNYFYWVTVKISSTVIVHFGMVNNAGLLYFIAASSIVYVNAERKLQQCR